MTRAEAGRLVMMVEQVMQRMQPMVHRAENPTQQRRRHPKEVRERENDQRIR
jgi:hypothetical protein